MTAVSTSPPWIGPIVGSHQGAQWQWWQLHIIAVVVNGGGGGERKDRMVTTCDVHDISTVVAQFGNLQVPIIN